MNLCPYCPDFTNRVARHVSVVTDKELKDPSFLRDVRAFTSGLGISPEDWPEYAIDIYRDFDGFIIDHERHVISLNTEHLETYPEWYREWVNTPVPPGVIPRPRGASRARIRVLVTLLKIKFPDAAAQWGRRAANDNDEPPRVRRIK